HPRVGYRLECRRRPPERCARGGRDWCRGAHGGASGLGPPSAEPMTAMNAPTTNRRCTARPIALVNARLIDPASGLDQLGGLLIVEDRIADLGRHIAAGSLRDAKVVDSGGPPL